MSRSSEQKKQREKEGCIAHFGCINLCESDFSDLDLPKGYVKEFTEKKGEFFCLKLRHGTGSSFEIKFHTKQESTGAFVREITGRIPPQVNESILDAVARADAKAFKREGYKIDDLTIAIMSIPRDTEEECRIVRAYKAAGFVKARIAELGEEQRYNYGQVEQSGPRMR